VSNTPFSQPFQLLSPHFFFTFAKPFFSTFWATKFFFARFFLRPRLLVGSLIPPFFFFFSNLQQRIYHNRCDVSQAVPSPFPRFTEAALIPFFLKLSNLLKHLLLFTFFPHTVFMSSPLFLLAPHSPTCTRPSKGLVCYGNVFFFYRWAGRPSLVVPLPTTDVLCPCLICTPLSFPVTAPVLPFRLKLFLRAGRLIRLALTSGMGFVFSPFLFPSLITQAGGLHH